MNVQLVYFAIKLVIYSAVAVFIFSCCSAILFLILWIKDVIEEMKVKKEK